MEQVFLKELKEYAQITSHVESVAVVGSYARGTNKETSDLDLIIITSNASEMIQDTRFIQTFGEVSKQQIEYYGACTSIRMWYKNGLEVEFGIVMPSWISMPLDIGTYKVLSDGYMLLIDKKGYFEDLRL